MGALDRAYGSLMYLSMDPAMVSPCVLYHGGYVRRYEPLRLHDEEAIAAVWDSSWPWLQSAYSIAIIINVFFLQSGMFQLILSAGMVLVFAGMTAWETQEVKNMYTTAHSVQANNQKGVFGAYLLYGSFMIMFIYILQIVWNHGRRRLSLLSKLNQEEGSVFRALFCSSDFVQSTELAMAFNRSAKGSNSAGSAVREREADKGVLGHDRKIHQEQTECQIPWRGVP